MQRITITIDDDLMESLDAFIEARGYANRSEAIRDLSRAGLSQAAGEAGTSGSCVGALMYIYDHEARELPQRLMQNFHEHHDLVLATLHVHLDHANCMEIAAVRGKAATVRHFAEHVIAERGVKHGHLMLVPGKLSEERHPHGEGGSHRHTHIHVGKRS
ncbi:MAG: nickel-responsive transcriptional regulator NikR [Gammaproteobacteria bacterium PRO9]|nr:nickel-responsive transcriptional regulator NikR [Gammaproteobacteria bacterium PRO9]